LKGEENLIRKIEAENGLIKFVKEITRKLKRKLALGRGSKGLERVKGSGLAFSRLEICLVPFGFSSQPFQPLVEPFFSQLC
jgi:hypothetical protein